MTKPASSRQVPPESETPPLDIPEEPDDNIDELVAVWNDTGLSLEDKLLKTFSGLGSCLPRRRGIER